MFKIFDFSLQAKKKKERESDEISLLSLKQTYLIKFTNLERKVIHTTSVSGSAPCEVSAVVNCVSSVKECSVQNQIDFLHRNKQPVLQEV